jgi:hypothetical protein
MNRYITPVTIGQTFWFKMDNNGGKCTEPKSDVLNYHKAC